MNLHSDGELTRWPVYLVGVFIILWSVISVGGGWVTIYASAYAASQLRDPEMRQEFESWVEELGKDPQHWRRTEWREKLAELERSGEMPRPLAAVVPLARKFSHYQPLFMYVYAPFGLLAAIGAMVFRKWGWWCALVWLGTWVVISMTMAIALRSIAHWLAISLTVITLVITAVAFWIIWVRRPMYSAAESSAAPEP